MPGLNESSICHRPAIMAGIAPCCSGGGMDPGKSQESIENRIRTRTPCICGNARLRS